MRGVRTRQGYFFIVDAIMASLVLFAGLFIIFSGGASTQESLQPLVTLEDLVTTLSITPISSTVNDYYINQLLNNSLVPYPDATPLEQITYLMFTTCPGINCTSHAENYTRSLLESAVDVQYGAKITINGTVLATYGMTKPRYALARSIIVYARNETGLIGPVVGEVQLWG